MRASASGRAKPLLGAGALALATLLLSGATLAAATIPHPPRPTPLGDARASEGVLVAILDSGIDPDHVEFKDGGTGASLLRHWRDFVAGRADPYDDNEGVWHGTAVASLAVGSTLSNSRGIGLAVGKVSRADGAFDPHVLAEAIRHAVDAWGVDVISISANTIIPVPGALPATGLMEGRPLDARVVAEAIAYAESREVLVVVAAGNGLGGNAIDPRPLPSETTAYGFSPYALVVGGADEAGRPFFPGASAPPDGEGCATRTAEGSRAALEARLGALLANPLRALEVLQLWGDLLGEGTKGATCTSGEVLRHARGYNSDPDVVQVARDVTVARPGGGHAEGYHGTSFATPVVASEAARLIQAHLAREGVKPAPAWTRAFILGHAVETPGTPYAAEGYGLADAEVALAAYARGAGIPARPEDDAAHAAALWARYANGPYAAGGLA